MLEDANAVTSRSGRKNAFQYLKKKFSVQDGAKISPIYNLGAAADQYFERQMQKKGSKDLKDSKSVKRTSLVEHLSNLIQQSVACKSFVTTVLTLAVFILSVYVHEKPESMHVMNTAVTQALVTCPFSTQSIDFTGVLNYDDFWDWTKDVLVPNVFVTTNTGGVPINTGMWGRLQVVYISGSNVSTLTTASQRYNIVIGGVRFFTRRTVLRVCSSRITKLYAGNFSCFPEAALSSASYGVPICGGSVNTSCVEASSYPYVDASSNEGFEVADGVEFGTAVYTPDVLYMNAYVYKHVRFRVCRHSRAAFWLPIHYSSDENLNRVQYLIDRAWLDYQTKHTGVEMLLYNPELEIMAFVSLTASFYRGGNNVIDQLIHPMTVGMQHTANGSGVVKPDVPESLTTSTLVVDILFILVNATMLLYELQQIRIHFVKSTLHAYLVKQGALLCKQLRVLRLHGCHWQEDGCRGSISS
jgi:hypothetical protein